MDRNRVVVTGAGLITPLGLSVKANWEALCRGASGVRRIDRFDVSDLSSQVAGLVTGFDPGENMDRKEIRRTDPFIQYGIAASVEAMADSGLVIGPENEHRVGVVVGSGMGGLSTVEKGIEMLRIKGPNRVSPFYIPMIIPNLASGQIAIRFGAKGPNLCIVTACSAGTHSVGHAFRLVREGRAEAVIAGGTEACVTRLGVAAFCAMRALSKHNDVPEAASRPFERDRDGFVIAEGAGVLIVESLDHALRRDAHIYGEIVGYGENGDAYHIAAPSPEGEGAAICMQETLRDGGQDPSDVDYINAHGTGTPHNDLTETLAIKKTFGDHARSLMISATKSMTGHLLGAVGAVEAIYTLLSLERGILPPTINYDNPDPVCDLDYVPNVARERRIEVAMSNSFGFGGTNASILFRRFGG